MASHENLISVLIVGAGEFGATAALALLKTGRYSVTLIDRAPILPAEDAASVDINKIIRFDYANPDYMRLAKQALDEWKTEEWKGIYHQSGTIVAGLEGSDDNAAKGRKVMAAVQSTQEIEVLDTPSKFTHRLDPDSAGTVAPQPEGSLGYFNPNAGWAHATAALQKVYVDLARYKCVPIAGAEVVELILEGENVKGVKCLDGRTFLGDRTIIATGSWTASLFGGLISPRLLHATGVCVAAVQLDREEMRTYAKMPVVMEQSNDGFYSLPPTEDGLVKFVFYRLGFYTEDGVPRTSLSPGVKVETEKERLSWMTRDSLSALRFAFGRYYPDLASKPLALTRMCWHNETPDYDWIIDDHPAYTSLLVATGGSGHAFKFLPVMGDLIKARFEGTLESSLQMKWGFAGREQEGFETGVEWRAKLKIENLAKLEEI